MQLAGWQAAEATRGEQGAGLSPPPRPSPPCLWQTGVSPSVPFLAGPPAPAPALSFTTSRLTHCPLTPAVRKRCRTSLPQRLAPGDFPPHSVTSLGHPIPLLQHPHCLLAPATVTRPTVTHRSRHSTWCAEQLHRARLRAPVPSAVTASVTPPLRAGPDGWLSPRE